MTNEAPNPNVENINRRDNGLALRISSFGHSFVISASSFVIARSLPHETRCRRGSSSFHHHLRSGARPLASVPPEHQRAGDVDARIGPGDNADQERERKVIDRATAKNEQRERPDKDRAGS